MRLRATGRAYGRAERHHAAQSGYRRQHAEFQHAFSQRRIELVFDEWVTLSDVGTQVVVSPTLLKRPEVKLKGKKVVVELPEEDTLRPNTTYTINFGTAVKDLHEGNPAENLRFVFSTGDYLDSLTVNGSVVDAFTGDPVEKVSVMLYENLGDSVPRKERPYYFARTNKTGQFSIQNVRPGRFKAWPSKTFPAISNGMARTNASVSPTPFYP